MDALTVNGSSSSVGEIATAAARVCRATGLPFNGVYRQLMEDAGLLPGVGFTEQELAAAFMEWDRRYREEPARFMSEAHHLLKETPETYGAACAPYLLALLRGDV
jgi:hypothetical protein